MKKIFIICFMFVLMFITGCTEETPLALMKMREFDKANSSEFILSLGMGSGEIELFKYGYKENEFIYLEVLQDINICYITNLENNYKYYDGFMWDGKVKLSETEVKEVKFLDYMTDLTYSEYDTRSFIDANFDLINFLELFDVNLDDYAAIDKELYSSATCKVIVEEDKVLSITIKVEDDSIIIDSINYNEDVTFTPDFDKEYEEVSTYEEYQSKLSEDLLNIFGGSKPVDTPKGLKILKSFENANALEFNVNFGWENSTMTLLKYAYKENEFVYLEMLEIFNYTTIYDLANGYEYYNGTTWSGRVKNEYDDQLNINISNYLYNNLYTTEGNNIWIDGNIDLLKLLEDIGFNPTDFPSDMNELYQKAYCQVSIYNDSVTSIVIKIEDDIIIIDSIKYNNKSTFKPNYDKLYENVETYEEFQNKKSEDLSGSFDTDILMKDVTND
ncbi:MAG: hypothetical protein E7183_06675 [Erysipelotrichaceae bacterium]|nr:hypothetical protein [Erysipelotrichaceae bacterium]